MLVSADLPAEFHEPVAYYDRWLWLALLAFLLVGVYYVAVLVLTRARTQQPADTWRRPAPPAHPRQRHLGEIDRIEGAARRGEIGLREAHQQLSDTVRGYVDTVTPLPASTMSLADLKAAAPGELAHAIELMYPPEFAPDDENEAQQRFDAALHHARRVVATWQ
jgi:hypothetical protein